MTIEKPDDVPLSNILKHSADQAMDESRIAWAQGNDKEAQKLEQEASNLYDQANSLPIPDSTEE